MYRYTIGNGRRWEAHPAHSKPHTPVYRYTGGAEVSPRGFGLWEDAADDSTPLGVQAYDPQKKRPDNGGQAMSRRSANLGRACGGVDS